MTLATIQEIRKIEPIPEADSIEVATVLGWKVVIARKDGFREGQKCIYVEIDSMLPEKPEFEFMRQRGFKVKTAKFRGQISQGIIFPMNILPVKQDLLINTDVTELLEITKFEKPVPIGGEIKGRLPLFIPKTDEPRIERLPEIFEKYHNRRMYVTEKLDGTSFTVFIKDGQVGICQRNYEQKVTETNSSVHMAVFKKFGMRDKLVSYHGDTGKSIALQGEIIGPGINKNVYKIKEPDVYFFNAFDIDEQEYLDYNFFTSLVREYFGFKTVPIITDDFWLGFYDIEKVREFCMKFGSKLYEGIREGIVIRAMIEKPYDFNFGRLSFKSVNPDYLLKYRE